KIVAAHRAGLRRVMLPARNRKDFEDIPEEVRQQLAFIWLERVDDAVSSALEAAKPTKVAGPPPAENEALSPS
ncbi:MAG TPA: S16 family serine protease, partial [Roseiarcus sp.]|nr:S16 family serine protease [Roseiarcus sp.]